MTDVFSKAKRSEVMARIRSRENSTTEIRFATLLRTRRITGWRRHKSISIRPRRLPGPAASPRRNRDRVRPDFVFAKSKLVVFVDGCFWHSCPWHSTKPKGNGNFWVAKLTDNRARDRYVTSALRRRGWTVVRIWEHSLSERFDSGACVQRVVRHARMSRRSKDLREII